MKTSDEIKKGLSMCSGETRRTCSECPYYLGEACCDQCESDALAYIRQLEAEKPRWISVEDRLPEDDEFVLVVLKANRPGEPDLVTVARYNKRWWYLGYITHDVTRWMPLPEPPENGKEESK